LIAAAASAFIATACSSDDGPAEPVVADSREIDCTLDFGDPLASLYDLPFRTGRSYRLIQGHCPSNPAWGHHNWFAWDFDFAMTSGGALVDVGDSVQQGDPIGLSGDSGCSSGTHLHIALFRDRTNFDRQSTLPVNFANAAGPLDSKHAPVQGGKFTAQ